MITAGRAYLDGAGFVEVETPILQPLYGGASARPFTTHHNELDRTFYLRIATELYLKRLIVGGLERVYEIGKNFRNEGVSFKHNPEFTVIEWYEAYADYTDGMRRTEEFTAASVRGALGTTVITRDGREIDMAPPWPRKPLAEAIQRGLRRRRAWRTAGADGVPSCAPRSSSAAQRRPRATRPGRSSSTARSRTSSSRTSSSPSSSPTTRPSSRRWRARSPTTRRSSSATRRSAAAWSSRTATAS